MHVRVFIFVVGLSALLTACPGGAPGAGSLDVSIAGLPAGVDADVSVNGPGGFALSLTASDALTELTPGSYVIEANDVVVDDDTCVGTATGSPATVAPNANASASVLYAAQEPPVDPDPPSRPGDELTERSQRPRPTSTWSPGSGYLLPGPDLSEALTVLAGRCLCFPLGERNDSNTSPAFPTIVLQQWMASGNYSAVVNRPWTHPLSALDVFFRTELGISTTGTSGIFLTLLGEVPGFSDREPEKRHWNGNWSRYVWHNGALNGTHAWALQIGGSSEPASRNLPPSTRTAGSPTTSRTSPR